MNISFDTSRATSFRIPFSSDDQLWFFRIDVRKKGGPKLDADFITSRIPSLAITEERGQPMLATLRFTDETGTLKPLLRYGTTVYIEWGTKPGPGGIPYERLLGRTDPDELAKARVRGPVKFFVIDAECQMKAGLAHGNISLRAGALSSRTRKSREFTSGTVGDMLRKLARELDFEPAIEIRGAKRTLNTSSFYKQQNETNLQFLKRIASPGKEGFILWYGDDERGKMHMFCVDADDENQRKRAQTRGAKAGWYHRLDHGGDFSPLLDGFKFRQNLNNNMGSTVIPTRGPNGEVTAIQVRSPTESEHFWEFNRKKVEKEFAGDKKRIVELMKEIMAAGLEELIVEGGLYHRYFDKVKNTTAPEGIGWTGSGSVVPSPKYSAGEPCLIGLDKNTAIPDVYTHYTSKGARKRRRWAIHKVETTINGGGASQSLEIWN